MSHPKLREVGCATSPTSVGIGSVDLGRSMLWIALDTSWRGSRTLENKDLKALLTLSEGPHR